MLSRLSLSRSSIPYHARLTTPLLRLGRRDRLTIGDLCEGALILGGTGSGKTSGSGQAIARAMLEAGFGGLVLCAKVDEAERWRDYAYRAGREHCLITVDARAAARFNFLDYTQATEARAGFDHNLVDVMARVAEAAAIADTSSGDGDNRFFRDAALEMLAHAFPILRAAYGRLRLKDVLALIKSAPVSLEQAGQKTWQTDSFCSQTLLTAAHRAKRDPAIEQVLEDHADYWMVQFPQLGERTRSSIVATLTSTIYPFLSGKLAQLFCSDTTVVPELTHEGAIILLDLPVKDYGRMGAVAQQIFKYLWQRATERRPAGKRTRPVFLFADECQFFLNSYDAEFLSTARQARACTIYMTQDKATFYAQLGGKGGRDVAEALIGKFQTRIFHANTDLDTNRYAADIIGKTTHYRSIETLARGWNSGASGTQTEQDGSYGGGDGANISRQLGETAYQDYVLPPEEFGRSLRTGGPDNRGRVDAILIRNGRRWKATRRNYLKAAFRQ